MKSIIFYSRAGQGANTAAKILAEVLFSSGYQVQTFPEYDAARAGAPMQVFLRFSLAPIRVHSAIEQPDFVVSLDQGLSQSKKIIAGATKKTVFILNLSPKQSVHYLLKRLESPIYAVDANKIVLKYLQKPITNIAMLGALDKYLFETPEKRLQAEVYKTFKKKGEEIAQLNVKILDEAHDQINRI